MISREKPKRTKRPGHASTIGLAICATAVVLGFLTAFRWPAILAQGIYGVFGVYIFAILFLAFFVGLSIKFSRRYSVSKRYIAAAAVMLASVLTAIHLGVTNNQLDGMNFGSYLSHGFNNITPGGAIFAIPSFVLWNIFQGGIGSGIVLAVSAISSTAFLVTFIVTKQGVNKVIKVKPKKDNDIAPTIDRKSVV